MTLDRRKVLTGLAAGAASAAVLQAPRVQAQGTPLKIGLLTVKTGPLAQGGIQMEQGTVTFLKEKNYTMAGRKAELISADTGGNPAGAKTKAQELVERDHVDVILGPLAAFELLAITDYIAQAQTPLLSLAAAEDLTQRRPNPFFLRASATSSQAMHPMADYAAKELKLKRIITISEDFAFGYEQMGGFQQTFAGSNPLRFMKQYATFGLKLPVVGGETAGDDALLRSFGDEAIGMYSCCPYTLDLVSDSNKRFIAAMQKDYGVDPGFYASGLYINGAVVEAGLQKTGGKSDDKTALMTALKSVSLSNTPRGPIRFD